MKKEKSIRTKVFLSKICVGAMMIGSGVSGMFDDTISGLVIRIICLFILIVSLIILLKGKFEKGDEMSEQNYMKAQSSTMTIMNFVYCVFMIVFLLGKDFLQTAVVIKVDVLMNLFFVIYGIQELLVGIKFRRLEAE